MGSIERKHSNEVALGHVISQNPAPSTMVDKGAAISLVVSDGKEAPEIKTVSVPDVTGMTKQKAGKAIKGGGLAVGKIEKKYSKDVDAGLVISQNPAPSTKVEKGTSINLVISKGKKQPSTVTVTVPDVTGMTQEGAEKAIMNEGLTVGGVEFEYSSEIPQGRVISQIPAPTSKVDKGASIKLVVSRGEEPPSSVTVPDVVGMAQEEAESTLRDANLKGVCDGEVESRSMDPGCVVRQSIDPGTEVAEDTEVAFEIAVPPAMVSVPAIRGKSSDKAAELIEGAGLVYEQSEDYSDEVEEGCVISQDPAPEVEVPFGSTVSAVISLGPEPKQQVEVPDLMDFTWLDAKNALESTGLGADMVGDPDGTVTGQDIDAGTMVDAGTVVTVTLESPAKQVKVPKVEGLTWKKAKKVLKEAGLVADDTGDDDGLVVNQDPKDDATVDEGSVVRVEIDKDAKAKVPDLVGKSVETARQALDDIGFKPDPDMPNHGTISNQDPAAGEKAKWGTVVTLEVDTSEFE